MFPLPYATAEHTRRCPPLFFIDAALSLQRFVVAGGPRLPLGGLLGLLSVRGKQDRGKIKFLASAVPF